jgi:hypothetical protein
MFYTPFDGTSKNNFYLFTGNVLVSFGCPIKRCIEHSKKRATLLEKIPWNDIPCKKITVGILEFTIFGPETRGL